MLCYLYVRILISAQIFIVRFRISAYYIVDIEVNYSPYVEIALTKS